MRSVESLDMHRKIAGTIMACLQISEEEVAAEEEAMRLEAEEEELVVAIKTPHLSSMAHHLNLNLSPHHSLHNSPYSSPHSNPNHRSQTNNNSRSLLPQKPLSVAGQQAI